MQLKVILVTVVACLQLGYSQNCLRDEISAAFTREALANNTVYDGLLEKINETIHESISLAVQSELVQLLSPITKEINHLRSPGKSPCTPAHSCKEIYIKDATSTSGYYWVKSLSAHAVQVYCDMETTSCGEDKGWVKVSSIDMSNPQHVCPSGLNTLLESGQRLCSKNIDGGGCSSAHLNTNGVQYSKVCGKIIGYQQKTPDAFANYYSNRALTIDDPYVDGISLTHGQNPRHHIWTFAAALHEIVTRAPDSLCPCTNIQNPTQVFVPPFIGNDYFCDTASSEQFQFQFYPYDPLWDGSGCGTLNTCCSFNNPPWFVKQLPEATTDDVEIRLCTDKGRHDEDINFEKLDIYVQ